jgi:transposase-like protein
MHAFAERGYRERALDTRLGTLNLRVPKLRQGSYFPGFLEARETSEQALVAVIQEAWIGGVSTRRVDELVQAMGLNGISKSTVSKLCKDIDERVGGFLNRPLTGEWPYVWLDATYLKVRQGGRIAPVAAIIAVAANTEGRREIIGLGIGPSEAETFWTEFLRSLKARGLGGVRPVISDAHTGLKAAIARVFEATWQRCRVHWIRNALAHVSRGQHTVIAAAIRQAFDQPDRAHAGETWRKVSEQLRPRWPQLADLMDASEHDVLAYMSFPRQHRTKLHSTNPNERLNKEVKRRADVVGVRAFLRTNGSHALTPQRGLHHAPDRSGPVRSQRRMADLEPLHDGRGLRPDRQGGDRSHSQHNNESRLIMTSGHQGIYTSLTDTTGGPDGQARRFHLTPQCRSGWSRPSIGAGWGCPRAAGMRPMAAAAVSRKTSPGRCLLIDVGPAGGPCSTGAWHPSSVPFHCFAPEPASVARNRAARASRRSGQEQRRRRKDTEPDAGAGQAPRSPGAAFERRRELGIAFAQFMREKDHAGQGGA